ncbi:arylsulfatase [Niabella aurantiaca]|uniref:arylsulfatase n=1 Tax=Niabella aurantiaca TaxID=379900 RepID=UPI0003810BEA|nr:arylsulfatase [Niabella aurantiaca]
MFPKIIHTSFLSAVVFLSGLLGSNQAYCQYAGAASKPNIILIVADDLGYSDLGCYGSEIHTPNLDLLAKQGMRFTQFYNQAVCNISRVTFLTGLYPRYGKGPLLKNNMVTMAQVLQGAGYATILSGKWHLGGGATSPMHKGFQEFFGSMIGAGNHFDPSLPDPPFVHHSGPPHPFVHNGKVVTHVPDDYYTTDAQTDFAIRQIRKNVKQHQPFFLHLAFNAPHYPLQAWPEDIAKYKGRYDAGYEVLRKERYKGTIKAGVLNPKWGLPPTDKRSGAFAYDLAVPPWDSLSREEQRHESEKMEVYAAMVDRIDQNIGRLMDFLKSSGIADNTLIVFFSDNGGCASMITNPRSVELNKAYNKGKPIGGKDTYELAGPGWASVMSAPFRRYKVWTQEGGISTPMIVWWKGKIQPGGLTNMPSHIIDLFPTFLDASGAAYPETFEGKSILPLEGKSLLPFLTRHQKMPEREFGWFLYGNRAYRKGKWKAVYGVTTMKWELYNMDADRTECHDLAGKHPKIAKELEEDWYKWAGIREVPLDNSRYLKN